MARLVSPAEVGVALRDAIAKAWPAWVLADVGHGEPPPITVKLRAAVRSEIDYERIGYTAVQRWSESWDGLPTPGMTMLRSSVRSGGPEHPESLRVEDLAEAITFLAAVVPEMARDMPDLAAARDLAGRLLGAGAGLTAAILGNAWKLPPDDRHVLVELVRWLGNHPDASHLTRTQLPVPGMHTKWLTDGRVSLVRALTGRDLGAELRKRPAVVHFTYLDPAYRASGRRVHDSWTAGDAHEPAYLPAVVVIVENRDCRLFFPTMPDAIAVEGGGDAADALLDRIPWITGADLVTYWGDLDAEGFAILARLRATFKALGVEVPSILMDAATLDRFAHLRALTDKHGQPVRARGGRLKGLEPLEDAAYRRIATRGDVPVRRIEQEKLPLALAADALRALAERRA